MILNIFKNYPVKRIKKCAFTNKLKELLDMNQNYKSFYNKFKDSHMYDTGIIDSKKESNFVNKNPVKVKFSFYMTLFIMH